jgi:phage terminase large subunit
MAKPSGTVQIPAYQVIQPKQWEFMQCPARFRLYGGAKGGGKSHAMRMECVRQALSAPNVRGLALRRTFPEIEENMVVPMLSELPKGIYDYNATKGILTFRNGSTVRFGYCRNFKDVLQYQGIEYDFECIEELTHWQEKEFKILKTSLRTSRRGIVPNFFGSTNPGGVGHAWVRRIWIDRRFHKSENPADYAFIPARVYDNRFITENNPQYLRDLEDLPDNQRRAYLLGDWDVFEGQYFTEFNRDVHVVPPFIPVRGVKKRIVCGDYGFKKPSCVLWLALMNDDTVVCYRELYVTGLLYDELAARVEALTTQDEDIDYGVFDPSVVEKENEAGNTFSQAFRDHGVSVSLANNERLEGWNVVHKFLAPRPDPNGGRLTARLRITSNCANLIRTLPEMIHDEKDVEDLDTGLEDHAADALRYGLMEFSGTLESIDALDPVNESLKRRSGFTSPELSSPEEKDREDDEQNERASPNFLRQQW